MSDLVPLPILPQPDDSTCGPTCLQAIYGFWGETLSLDDVIADVDQLDGGGTFEVWLGTHALRRGYRARILTFNLKVFDPTWFGVDVDLVERLRAQSRAKRDGKLRLVSRAYAEFLELGGQVRMEDLTPTVLRRDLKRGVPVLAGLSATYLYGTARELGSPLRYDDVHGVPQGHFVVLCGYDKETRRVDVADPLLPNPVAPSHHYKVGIDRLVCAILLGIVTYDASLLVIEPK